MFNFTKVFCIAVIIIEINIITNKFAPVDSWAPPDVNASISTLSSSMIATRPKVNRKDSQSFQGALRGWCSSDVEFHFSPCTVYINWRIDILAQLAGKMKSVWIYIQRGLVSSIVHRFHCSWLFLPSCWGGDEKGALIVLNEPISFML